MKLFPLLGALLLAAVQSTSVHAQNLLQNGDFSQNLDGWTLPNPAKARAEVVETTGAAQNARALRLQITPAPDDKPWSAILRQPIKGALKKDAPLIFKAWLRSPQSLKTFAFVEVKDEKFTKSLEKQFQLSPQWQQFEISGQSKGDYEAGAASLGFHLAYGEGTVEMTGLQLENNAAALAPIQEVAPLPAAPILTNGSLVPNGDFAFPLEGNWQARGVPAPTISVFPATVEGQAKNALRIQTDPPANVSSWSLRVAAPKVTTSLQKNDMVVVRLWARSPDNGRMAVIFQQSVAPHAKTIFQDFSPTKEWKEFRFYAPTKMEWRGEVNFELHVGFAPGTLEIADVRVENRGQISLQEVEQQVGAQTINYWGGPAPNDAWKKAAFERIEKHRKGDLKIRVVDKTGKPIGGAKIKLTQTRQLFRWGSAVVAARLTDTQDPDNLRYQSEVKRLFNTIVFENDLKWRAGPQRKEQVAAALPWLQKHGIEARGHTLIWGSRRNMPDGIEAVWNDTEKLRAQVRERVKNTASLYKGQLYVWDVVNEAATNTELWEKLGWDEFANTFKIARESDPNALLAYNDYNISNERPDNGKQRRLVEERIQKLIDAKAPLDILGDQAHMSVPLTTPARAIEIWDDWAKRFQKPIEITEFDAGIPDDKMHGEYVRDFLIAAFSQPRIESFVQWGFWEPAHWRAAEGGAMFRRDWTKRPVQLEYERLVLNEWMTRGDFLVKTDGVLQTRGFLGDYSVTISANGKTKTFPLKLNKDGARVQIALN